MELFYSVNFFSINRLLLAEPYTVPSGRSDNRKIITKNASSVGATCQEIEKPAVRQVFVVLVVICFSIIKDDFYRILLFPFYILDLANLFLVLTFCLQSF